MDQHTSPEHSLIALDGCEIWEDAMSTAWWPLMAMRFGRKQGWSRPHEHLPPRCRAERASVQIWSEDDVQHAKFEHGLFARLAHAQDYF